VSRDSICHDRCRCVEFQGSIYGGCHNGGDSRQRNSARLGKGQSSWRTNLRHGARFGQSRRGDKSRSRICHGCYPEGAERQRYCHQGQVSFPQILSPPRLRYEIINFGVLCHTRSYLCFAGSVSSSVDEDFFIRPRIVTSSDRLLGLPPQSVSRSSLHLRCLLNGRTSSTPCEKCS
jgi:hypothetical protein